LSQYSKALGVNARTLELFEKSGITEKFLKNGRQMSCINIWKGEKLIFRNDFERSKHRYPFMLVQPQKETEEILADELSLRGIKIEFGTELKSVKKEGQFLTACMNDDIETKDLHYIIGADGPHSRVRKEAGIETNRFTYQEEWELYDVELETPVDANEGHIRLFEEGGMIMIRLKNNVWRVGGNLKNLLNYLPKQTNIGSIQWQSEFKIVHMIALDLEKNNMFVIGDAAHLHSPVGARGMNLGIEDAYVLSTLCAQNKVKDYSRLRQNYLKRTVKRINLMTQGIGGHNFLARSIRKNIGLFKPFFPIAMPVVRKFMMGING
jgi:2-polyprenyl-6-methoxyphenol hydroxylase-like FAD-dependent oxidoreductase